MSLENPSSSGIVILLVEDNPTTQQTIRKMMETAFEGTHPSCRIVVSGSAEEGMEQLQKGLLPHMILLDIGLPGTSGGVFSEYLLDDKRWKEIPLFTYSSQWDEEAGHFYDEHRQIVQEWLAAQEKRKNMGAPVSDIAGKHAGNEAVSVVNAKLIIFVAGVLIRMNVNLSPSFQMLLDSARLILAVAR